MWNVGEALDDHWDKCMMGKETSSSLSPDGEVAQMINSRLIPRNGCDWRISMGTTLA